MLFDVAVFAAAKLETKVPASMLVALLLAFIAAAGSETVATKRTWTLLREADEDTEAPWFQEADAAS